MPPGAAEEEERRTDTGQTFSADLEVEKFRNEREFRFLRGDRDERLGVVFNNGVISASPLAEEFRAL